MDTWTKLQNIMKNPEEMEKKLFEIMEKTKNNMVMKNKKKCRKRKRNETKKQKKEEKKTNDFFKKFLFGEKKPNVSVNDLLNMI